MEELVSDAFRAAAQQINAINAAPAAVPQW